MKQKVMIEVEIDPQGQTDVSDTAKIMHETVEGGITYSSYRIRVNPDKFATVGSGDPGGLMTTLAHELGHVMGGIFTTEAHQADSRAMQFGMTLGLAASRNKLPNSN